MPLRCVISGQRFELDRERIEHAVVGVLPEPIQEHYVVVGSMRYPPKQVLSIATGLDRADFTTHQARRILRSLGFTAARRHDDVTATADENAGGGPHGGRQAAALRPYVGKWVALAGPFDVLVAADTPQEVLAWLNRHGRRADYGMLRVPESLEMTEGVAPA
jgi:hypothetical protein